MYLYTLYRVCITQQRKVEITEVAKYKDVELVVTKKERLNKLKEDNTSYLIDINKQGE